MVPDGFSLLIRLLGKPEIHHSAPGRHQGNKTARWMKAPCCHQDIKRFEQVLWLPCLMTCFLEEHAFLKVARARDSNSKRPTETGLGQDTATAMACLSTGEESPQRWGLESKHESFENSMCFDMHDFTHDCLLQSTSAAV